MTLKIEGWQLAQKQSLPLQQKIELSKHRIRQWHDQYHGQVYVAFSGGKDSTVLLHLVRSIYPDTKALFVDTGMEHPGNKVLVGKTENCQTTRPKKTFKQVTDRWGFPVVSKTVSMAISRYRNTKRPDQKEYRLHGCIRDGKKLTAGTIPKKYHYLINAPFKISEKCCEIMKKEPFKRFEKETGLKPFIGTMASDSINRKIDYLKRGCNVHSGSIQSRPLSIWTEQDIWDYIKLHNLPYSVAYDMGEDRTGCLWCPIGVQFDETPNRFQRMQVQHPAQYKCCMDNMGMREVLTFMSIPFKN